MPPTTVRLGLTVGGAVVTGALTAALTGGLAAGLPGVLDGTAQAGAHAETVLRFDVRPTQGAELDLGAKGLGVGDSVAFSNELRRRGRVAGHGGGVCTAVRTSGATVTFSCTGSLALDRGQIAMTGQVTATEREQPLTLAVVGGTGGYRGASGELRIDQATGAEERYTVMLDR